MEGEEGGPPRHIWVLPSDYSTNAVIMALGYERTAGYGGTFILKAATGKRHYYLHFTVEKTETRSGFKGVLSMPGLLTTKILTQVHLKLYSWHYIRSWRDLFSEIVKNHISVNLAPSDLAVVS